MCLSTAYEVCGEVKTKVGEYISGIQITDDGVIVTDIMGSVKTVPGLLKSIDLIKNEILIETKA